MPFTFSHPALIIPLLRGQQRFPWLSATGLITGSIAPDFEKFLRLRLASNHSHTLASVFYFSLPVGLLLAFIFHLAVRRSLLTHLPAPLYQRLGRFISFDWLAYFRRYYGGVVFSIIVGALLHLGWDSFTHPSYLVVKLLPKLSEPVGIGGEQTPIFFLVGLVSSVFGLLVIGWSVWRMPVRSTRTVPSEASLWRYWGVAALVASALTIEWVLVVGPRLLDAGIALISSSLVG
ncbi:MAG: DUF4184 family protein, partial [Hymenobacter sp.]